MTSEKSTPSPICLVGDMSSAVAAERGLARRPGAKTALKDVLSRCIAEYNKMTTLKRHRIDSSKRALIYNLLLACIRSISDSD